MASQLSLNNSKSSQVSRILLSILADLKNTIVWIVFTHPLICMSSSLYINLLVIVPSASLTIIITYSTVFFSSSPSSRYLFLFWLSFNFTLWSSETAKTINQQVLFFVDYH